MQWDHPIYHKVCVRLHNSVQSEQASSVNWRPLLYGRLAALMCPNKAALYSVFRATYPNLLNLLSAMTDERKERQSRLLLLYALHFTQEALLELLSEFL